MSSFFKKFGSLLPNSDDDEEIDVNFDLSEPEPVQEQSGENNNFSLPLNHKVNKVLAVWGSPSSGKTIVSVKLARYLAGMKKNTVLLLCDMTAPPLPFICPSSDLDSEYSLGNILAAPIVTEDLVKQNAILHKKNEYLTVFGMLKGENVFSYAQHTEVQAREFISQLKQLADYVIIDCTSHITGDTLTAVSLIESDAVLRLVSCDLKAISYLSSQMPLLQDGIWNADKQYKAVSNIGAFQAKDNVEQIVGGVHYKIPHSDEVEQQFLNGNLLGGLNQKNSAGFRKTISKIAKEVFAFE